MTPYRDRQRAGEYETAEKTKTSKTEAPKTTTKGKRSPAKLDRT